MPFHLKRIVDITRHKKTANMEEGAPKEICTKCKEIQGSCDSLKKETRNLKVLIKNNEGSAEAIFSESGIEENLKKLTAFKIKVKEHYSKLEELKEKIDAAYIFIKKQLEKI